MGTHTLNPSAAAPACGLLRHAAHHYWLAASALVTVCVLSSTPARAGFREISTTKAAFPVDHRAIAAADSSTPGFDSVNKPCVVAASAAAFGNDPLSVDPMTRGILLSDYSSATTNWIPSESTTAVSNALPKSSDAPPLLIPLPTAATAGAWGLAVVAVLLAAKRTLRRRLFA